MNAIGLVTVQPSFCAIAAIALGVLLLFYSPASAGDADAKIVAQLVREIEQLSSLYAKNEKPVAIAAMERPSRSGCVGDSVMVVWPHRLLSRPLSFKFCSTRSLQPASA